MRTMEFKTLSIMENVCFAAVNHAGTDLSGNKLDKCDFWEGLKGHFSELWLVDFNLFCLFQSALHVRYENDWRQHKIIIS